MGRVARPAAAEEETYRVNLLGVVASAATYLPKHI